MVDLNMNRPAAGRCEPGVHLAYVETAEVKHSSNGDWAIVVTLKRSDDGAQITRDWIMLEGPGWGMGKEKLTALGVPRNFEGDFDAGSLAGKRVWVAVETREYTKKDGTIGQGLSVDIKQLKYNGYQPMDDPPPGCTVPEEVDTGTPF